MEQQKAKSIRDWYNDDFAPWQRKVADLEAMQGEQRQKLRAHLPELQALVGMLLDGKTKQAVDLWNRLGIHPALRNVEMLGGGDMLKVTEAGGNASDVSVADIVRLVEGLA